MFLELLNGAGVAPEVICLALLAVYISKESRRRGLRWFHWLRLPPSMNLVLAIFIFDSGAVFRSLASWERRRFHDYTEFVSLLTTPLVVIGSILVVTGALCQIRALTSPDHGDGPWVASAVATIAVMVMLWFLH